MTLPISLAMNKSGKQIIKGLLIAAMAVGFQPAYSRQPSGPATEQSAQAAAWIEGSVTDASTGRALPGARVSVINSRHSAITDGDGAFRIGVPFTRATVTVSAPGYKQTVTAFHSGKKLDVKLLPAAGETNIYDVDALDADARSTTILPPGQTSADDNVADLQGKLLAISRSGMPGSGHTVYIDGLHSLSASSQPLYVVDGVLWSTLDASNSTIDGHFENPLALIAAEDIENIYVLKNGEAIYGTKGGNGVVYIETKRAKNEATEIEAFARMGWRGGIKTIPVMDAAGYRAYASDIIRGRYTNSAAIDRLNFLNDDPASSQYAMNHNNTNWMDLATRTGLLMNYGVNIRGGDDRALYSFMLGYTDNQGPLKETSFSRINVRFNSDINLWQGFKLRFDVAYAQADYNIFDDGINPQSSLYYLSMIKSPLYHPYVLTADGAATMKYADSDELGVGNPMNILDLAKGDNRNYRFNLNVAPSYKINGKVSLKGIVAYTFDKIKENSFLPDYGLAETKLLNNNGEVYFTVKNMVANLMNRHTAFIAGVGVDYTPLKNVVHQLDLHGNLRYHNDTYITSLGTGYNTSSDQIKDLANTTLRDTYGYDATWRSLAYAVSGEYSFLKRYLLSASATLESSSRAGRKADAIHIGGVSWGLFPSVAAAWLMSSESWMADAKWLNLLKLRIGFDMAGNDNLPLYATRTYFDSNHFLGNAYGPVIANLGNDKLKWETTCTLRAGLDMSMFGDRWQLGFDFYTSRTNDLLVAKPLQEESGLSRYWANGGALDNKGISLSTTVRAVSTRDWNLSLGASIGHYKNRVSKLDDGDILTDACGGTVLTSIGHPVGVFYGYRSEGVFATDAQAREAGLRIRNANNSYSYFAAGDMHFNDRDANGIINDADRQIIGDPNPDFYGNFNLRLSWKNLSLSSVFTYSVGNDVYNALRAQLESGSDIHNQSTAMLGRWMANGQQTDIPRATYGDPMGNSRFSDRWIEDGSYLKWKSLSLDYRIPISSPYIQGVTLSFTVNNLCTWTKYLGPDPEFSYGTSPLFMGVDAGLLPSSREFNFGVKINL